MTDSHPKDAPQTIAARVISACNAWASECMAQSKDDAYAVFDFKKLTDLRDDRDKAIDALIAAVRSEPAPGWQLIETAPENTKVLVYTSDFGLSLLGCAEFKRFSDGSSGWIGASFHDYGGKSWSTIARPTHWQPLPPSPGAPA